MEKNLSNELSYSFWDKNAASLRGQTLMTSSFDPGGGSKILQKMMTELNKWWRGVRGGQPAAGGKNISGKKVILDFGGVKNRQNDDGIKYVIMGGGGGVKNPKIVITWLKFGP